MYVCATHPLRLYAVRTYNDATGIFASGVWRDKQQKKGREQAIPGIGLECAKSDKTNTERKNGSLL